MASSLYYQRSGKYSTKFNESVKGRRWPNPSKKECVYDIAVRYAERIGLNMASEWNELLNKITRRTYSVCAQTHAESMHVELRRGEEDYHVTLLKRNSQKDTYVVKTGSELHIGLVEIEKEALNEHERDYSHMLKELIPLKDLPPTKPSDFPPSIYFLFQKKKLVYVGETVALQARVRAHIKEGIKKFDRFTHIDAPKDRQERQRIERLYIAKHQPMYNAFTHDYYEKQERLR